MTRHLTTQLGRFRPIFGSFRLTSGFGKTIKNYEHLHHHLRGIFVMLFFFCSLTV